MEARNPYTSMLKTMGGEARKQLDTNGMKLYLGKVLSPDPLSVSVCGTVQNSEHFYINEALCTGHKENVRLKGSYEGTSLTCSCTGSYNAPSISGQMKAEVEEKVLEPVLQAGDLVVCLSADDQIFYLLCRVVKAS